MGMIQCPEKSVERHCYQGLLGFNPLANLILGACFSVEGSR